jgi:hypothetical protein
MQMLMMTCQSFSSRNTRGVTLSHDSPEANRPTQSRLARGQLRAGDAVFDSPQANFGEKCGPDFHERSHDSPL